MPSQREIVIITGVAGSGKTTLAKKIVANYPDFVLMSFDRTKEEVWDEWGYTGQTEKDLLREVALNLYRAEVLLNIQKNQNMVLEYPFKGEWNSFFSELQTKHLCNITYIGCGMSIPWGDLLEQKRRRDSIDTTRHIGHFCSTYHKGGLCVRYNKTEMEEFEKVLNREYVNRECFAFSSCHKMVNAEAIKEGMLYGQV